jgi:hypothetical protein
MTAQMTRCAHHENTQKTPADTPFVLRTEYTGTAEPWVWTQVVMSGVVESGQESGHDHIDFMTLTGRKVLSLG